VVKLKTAQTPILLIIFGTFILCQDFLTPTIDKEPNMIRGRKLSELPALIYNES